jgi:hypothetical protein
LPFGSKKDMFYRAVKFWLHKLTIITIIDKKSESDTKLQFALFYHLMSLHTLAIIMTID